MLEPWSGGVVSQKGAAEDQAAQSTPTPPPSMGDDDSSLPAPLPHAPVLDAADLPQEPLPSTPVGELPPEPPVLEREGPPPLSESPSPSKEEKSCEDLLSWPLADLMLISTHGRGSTASATFQSPKGLRFVVQRGALVGRVGARVVSIQPGAVSLAWIAIDQAGEPQVRQRTLLEAQ